MEKKINMFSLNISPAKRRQGPGENMSDWRVECHVLGYVLVIVLVRHFLKCAFLVFFSMLKTEKERGSFGHIFPHPDWNERQKILMTETW